MAYTCLFPKMTEDIGLKEWGEETVLGQGRGGRWEWQKDNENYKAEHREKKMYCRMSISEKKNEINTLHLINKCTVLKYRQDFPRPSTSLNEGTDPFQCVAKRETFLDWVHLAVCLFLLAGCPDVSSLRPDGASLPHTPEIAMAVLPSSATVALTWVGPPPTM